MHSLDDKSAIELSSLTDIQHLIDLLHNEETNELPKV